MSREKFCDSCGASEKVEPLLETVYWQRRWILFGRKVRVVVHTCRYCNFFF